MRDFRVPSLDPEFLKIMNANKYLSIIQHFIPQASDLRLLHTHEQIEHEGVFYYFSVNDRAAPPRTVCLFESFDIYTDPLMATGTFPLLEAIEDGYGYAVVGCYSTNGDIVRPDAEYTGSPADLRANFSDKHYYLYLLAK